jgi:hypothetical protein
MLGWKVRAKNVFASGWEQIALRIIVLFRERHNDQKRSNLAGREEVRVSASVKINSKWVKLRVLVAKAGVHTVLYEARLRRSRSRGQRNTKGERLTAVYHRSSFPSHIIDHSLMSSPVKTCNSCHKIDKGLSVCGSCKKVYYCSVECQKLDWKQHKAACKESCRRMDIGVIHVERDVNVPNQLPRNIRLKWAPMHS